MKAACAVLTVAGLAASLAAQPRIAARMDCPATVEAAQQPRVALVLEGPQAAPVSGRLTLTFTHNAVNGADDPAIQFSNGSRTASFTLAAGSTRAEAALQSGTVAGSIRITAALESAGADVTPSPAPACTITLARAAPVITDLRFERTGSGFNLYVTGYSTPRQVLEARYRFLPKSGYQWQPIEIVLPQETLSSRFTDWFRSGTSAQYGSQFTLLQPFTADQNFYTIGSVVVTLRNAEGLSAEKSVTFP
jgi:hypothetical protein